jgi:hypothetical protein
LKKNCAFTVHDVKKLVEKQFYKNMLPEKDSMYVKVLENIFKKFGATRQVYYQTYTGNHIHSILKRSSEIAELLIHPDTGESLVNGKIRHACIALELLSKIQSMFCARMLTEDEINQLELDIEAYKNFMKEHFGHYSVTHKSHLLLRHSVKFARKHKNLNVFSEGTIENQHHVNKKRLRLLATKDEHKRLQYLLKTNWEQNISFDQGTSLL